jgi:hypothetical protein
MLSKEYFIKAMTGLCDFFDTKPSEFVLEVYWDLLNEFKDEEIGKAIKNVLKHYKYPSLPKPAEIVEAALEIRRVNNQRVNMAALQLEPEYTPEQIKQREEFFNMSKKLAKQKGVL